jgi:alpha-L-fucosidase
VRQLCADYGRAEVGDQCIGKLLSKAPADENGRWPCRPVCDALETLGSAEIATGFRIGVYNARGAHWRAEGGSQERELAGKYRAWAQALAFEYPYVSEVVEGVARSYDRDAEWHDSEANVRKRLRH